MLREIPIKEFSVNPITLFRDDWMLLTAGNAEAYNTMTVGWGHIGQIWGYPTVVAYVRPERYTKPFMDRELFFTLTRFDAKYRNALKYLGTRSGRNEDKVGAVGLTPMFSDNAVSFAEANLTMICRKLYQAPLLQEGFVDQRIIDGNYPDRLFHEVYYGEIVKVLARDPA